MTWESDRRAVGTYEWVRALTSIDFDESPDLKDSAGRVVKRPAGKTLKGVAFRLGYWGNSDGTKVYLGPARIAVCCETDYKTAKLILRTLCAYKLLTLVQRGGGVATAERESNGGEYRLTIPHDLDRIAKVRTAEEIEAEIEAVKEKNRNKGTGQRRPRNSRGRQYPVSEADSAGDTGQSTPPEDESRGNGGGSHGAISSAIPTQHLPVKENQPSSSLSARTSVPGPRDPADDRERDDSTSSADPNLTWHQRLVIDAGCPTGLAAAVSDRLQARYPNRGPGWWRKVHGIGDLAELVRETVEAITSEQVSHCAHCNGTGKVPGRSQYGDTPTEHDCPACTPITSDQRRAFIDQLAGHPSCDHGYEGGNLPMPYTGWMRCAECRKASGYVPVEDRNRQGRTSERRDVAVRVNVPEGTHTAAWDRRRRQHAQPAEARKAQGWLDLEV